VTESTPLALSAAMTPPRSDAITATPALWPALIVLLLAALYQAAGSLPTDVSWLITLAEKTLDGQRPYVDFIEANPPASILIYLAPVSFARLFGLSPEPCVVVFCFLGAAGGLTFCALALGGRKAVAQLGPFGVAVGVAVLTLFPARAFAQREHIAVIFGLPFFAALAAKASGVRVDWRLGGAAGLGAGVMIAIKPHLALAVLTTLPYFAWRIGFKRLILSVELYAAVIPCIAYGGLTALFFSNYLSQTAPILIAIYGPIRESYLAMLGGEGFIAWLLPAICLLVLAREKLVEPIVAVPALASLGAMIAFFIQGKDWPYQSYPAIAFILIALGIALSKETRAANRPIVSAVCFLAFAFACRFIPALLGSAASIAIAICGAFVVLRILSERSPGWRAVVASFAQPVVASGAGFAFLWLSHQNGSPPLQQIAEGLTPHPRVLAISQDIGVGHPFTRQVGGIWSQRVASLWITAGARILLKKETDPVTIEKLQSYLRLDRDMLVEDIRRNRPDIILISNRFGEFHDWAFADPLIAAALADYRLYASDGETRGETFLYARADLTPLRPSLNEATPDAERAR
jgi:hypothetical protein